MDAITGLLTTLNTLSPLAVIALLGLVIFMLVKAKGVKLEVDKKVETLRTNDLHELPEIAENLRILVATMQRIEVEQGREFAHLRARLNGHK